MAAICGIVARARCRLIVVPGGGPFADTVRNVQGAFALSDAACHRLALLSMHQMALVIAGHSTRFTVVQTLAELAVAIEAGQIPVWQPYALQSDDPTLPADWTTTSDALAARLAERLSWGSVALVKSCPVDADASLDELTAAGIVDPVFAGLVARAKLTWRIYGAGDEPQLAARLDTLE